MATERDAWIIYTNWKGETERRHIRPHTFWYGASSWHPVQQWLLGAWDLERDAYRTFALAGIHAWAATAEALPAIEEATVADPLDLAALDRLERRATPGPWATDHEHTVAGEDETTLLCHVLCGGGWTRVEDADLIVALRNAAPALLRAARHGSGKGMADAD